MRRERFIPLFRTPPATADGARERVAVLGLGNILFSDEGVGVRAAAKLSRQFIFSPAVDIIDGGTLGLDLLPYFQDRDRVLIIDAVDFGEQPGHIACIEQDAIRAVLNPKLSVHHIGLSDLLLAARFSRTRPLDLCLVGIQPQSLALGLEMTSLVHTKIDLLLDMTKARLQKWGILASSIPAMTNEFPEQMPAAFLVHPAKNMLAK